MLKLIPCWNNTLHIQSSHSNSGQYCWPS